MIAAADGDYLVGSGDIRIESETLTEAHQAANETYDYSAQAASEAYDSAAQTASEAYTAAEEAWDSVDLNPFDEE